MSQNLNVNGNAATTAVAVGAITSKTKKKEEEALTQLLAFIEQLKEELETLGSKSPQALILQPQTSSTSVTPPPPPPPTPPTPQPSNNLNDNETQMGANLCNALAEAAYYLSEMEASIIGKYDLNANQAQSDMIAAQQAFSAKFLQNAIEQADKITRKEEEQAHKSKIATIFSAIATAITSVIAFACGQPEIALLMIGMEIMNASGETNKLVGNSFYATLAVVAVTMFLSGGTGAIAGGMRLAIALMVQNMVQVLTSTAGLQNILKQIPMSESERDKVSMGLTITLAIVAVLAAIYAGSAMTNVMDQEVGENASYLVKMRAAIKAAVASINLSSPTTLMALLTFQRYATGAQALLEVRQGQLNIEIGEASKYSSEDYAVIEMMQALMDVMVKTVSDRQSIVSNQMQQSSAGQQTINSWLSGERAFSHVLASAV